MDKSYGAFYSGHISTNVIYKDTDDDYATGTKEVFILTSYFFAP